jgi:DNA polymerase-3 subunit delta'
VALAGDAGNWLPGSIDLYVVTPIEESRQIRIDQVRELVEQLSLTSHAGGATVAILNPAEVMNASAVCAVEDAGGTAAWLL